MTIPNLHMAAVTVEIIWELKFEIIPHPAYSADLASSDHQIFQPPEGATYISDEEVEDAEHMWLCMGCAYCRVKWQ